MIGRVLGRYKVVEALGAGGMGEVYLATDTRLGRNVALKVLPEALGADPERLKRLEREARALGSLDHPHIVTLYSVEEAEGVHFLTMALVQGETLEAAIPPGGLPVVRLVELALALADALRAAHEQGIVHRDLKPGNVMIDRDGRLRVLDFGLAKLVAQPSADAETQTATLTATAAGAIVGTVPYMSPEQIEGKPVDARSDLFSFGVMLYEMAVGRRPFEGESAMAVASAILREEPRPLAERRPELPERLRRIVARCLEKDLLRRVTSAALIREELQELKRELDAQGSAATANGPALATTAGGPALSAPKRLRISWPLTAAATAALAVASLIGLDVGGLRQRLPGVGGVASIRSLVVLPLTNLTGDSEQEYFVDGMTEALITDLSKIGALKVISRTSAMRYKGTDKSLREIARELGVEAVIEGSILREANRVRLNAQLVRAANEHNLWAQSYERDLTSILSLQSELARAIVSEIELQLTPQEAGRLVVQREVDPAAYDAYLKGIFHRHQFTPRDLTTALKHFSTALEIDPKYAAAHVGTGSIWAYRLVLGLVPQEEACRHWRSAVSSGLRYDDRIAEAHVGLAQILFSCDWDWEGADAEYRRAIVAEPGNAEAHMFYGNFLAARLRFREAEAEVKRALDLDPLNAFYHAGYGVQLLMERRFAEALAKFRRSYEIAPGGGFGHLPYWRALYWSGDLRGATEQLEAHLRMLGEGTAAAALLAGATEAGYREGARRAAETLASNSVLTGTRPMILVYLFDDAGDRDSALDWLDTAFEVRDLDMAYLGALEVSEELRSHPRYLDILKRVNLPLRESSPET